MDSRRLARGRGRGRDRRPRRYDQHRAGGTSRARARVADRRRRPGRPEVTRHEGDTGSNRGTSPIPRCFRSGRDRVYLRHHRPPERLHAEPRQHRRERPQLHAERRLRQGVQRGPLHAAVLPLAHSYAQLIQYGAVYSRTVLGLTDMADAVAELPGYQPTAVLSVPRLWQKAYDSAKHKADADGHGKIFVRAEAAAIAYSQALDAGGPGIGLRLPARRVRPAGLQQAAGGTRRRRAVFLERGCPAWDTARAFLPRRRDKHPGGLRPDRDQPGYQHQYAGGAEDRHHQGARSPAARSGSHPTGRCSSGAT